MTGSRGDLGPLSAAWERQAEQWAAWARAPGHDVYFHGLNWPALRALLPPAGRRTLDVGCGEGRIGRALSAEGHTMAGIDSSPTLVALAREAAGYDELVCGDAAALPWDRGAFDLAVAHMTLQDVDDLTGAVAEIARVLEPGGRLCLAITHPLNRPAELLLDGYFEEHRFADDFARDGLSITFEGVDRPLSAYTDALAGAGLLIEQLREPRPSAAAVEAAPRLGKAAKRPYFVHMRCLLAAP